MEKKGKDLVRRAAALVMLTSSFATTACNLKPLSDEKVNDFKSYSNVQQIERIAEALEVDISVMKFLSQNNENINRLKHNNGEPIYVSFDEGYPEDYKKIAQDSLDYVFSVIGPINEFYKEYEIVSSNEASNLENNGKTVI